MGCATAPSAIPPATTSGSTRRADSSRPLDIGHLGRDLGAEEFDAAQQVGVGQARIRHLQGDAVHATQLLRDTPKFGGDGVRVAKEERTVRTAGGIELRARRRRKTTFPGYLGEHLVPPWVDGV